MKLEKEITLSREVLFEKETYFWACFYDGVICIVRKCTNKDFESESRKRLLFETKSYKDDYWMHFLNTHKSGDSFLVSKKDVLLLIDNGVYSKCKIINGGDIEKRYFEGRIIYIDELRNNNNISFEKIYT